MHNGQECTITGYSCIIVVYLSQCRVYMVYPRRLMILLKCCQKYINDYEFAKTTTDTSLI